jgi:TetR/AcrR family transcriptional regulator
MQALQSLLNLSCPVQTKRERRKEARPGELLQAALALFVEKGFAATRVEEIARRAGVSKGTLFLYFASKEDLFKAVVRDNIVGQLAEFAAAIDAYQGPTPDLMRTFVHGWWQHVEATNSAAISKLMISEGAQFPELASFYRAEVIAPAQQLIARVLARGQARGEFRRVDPQYGPLVLLSSLIFLALWRNSATLAGVHDGQLDPRAYLDTLLDTCLSGLSIHPGAAVKPTV